MHTDIGDLPQPAAAVTALRRAALLALAGLALVLLPRAGLAAQPASGHAGSAERPVARVLQSAQELAIYALGLIGVDYRYGGNSPDRGLDCSGLVRYVFQEVVGVTLPRTAREMARLGGRVAPGELRAGDLVFFNTRSSAFSHVGIYLGDDRFIHAPHRGGEVEIVTMSQPYWQQRYDGARRLVGVMAPDLISSAHAAPAPLPAAANADSHR
ncbi:MAG TPA: C40 family peptidase [Casimicrobiaceae bacterium]|jgi:cell wall-associated NlpC family hydrolase|nr:C40 family peptidase [Casimicrobiaceae bacterium]